ncbi:urease accessory protein [filamentous cyanobacterium CCP1]|nr:urease accessory protein [filamentous cyanobacterium CCP2]PSB67198.1 urease accessory protein [filamentous cyanobacterium CCP1]
MSSLSLSPSSSSNWCGHLHLEFLHRSSKTILSHSHAQAPLKIQRPFYPEGDAVCHSVMLHTAGGIAGSDRLSNQIILHPHAQALVTTAAAAKVYGRSGKDAQQITQISIAEGACLEWFPQETIVFDGAIYQQEMRVELAANAMWFGWEVTRLGRSARGERFASGIWRSKVEVWQGDQLLWVDPQGIQGGSEMLDSLHGLAGCPVVASFVMLGRSVVPEDVEKARSVWQGSGEVGVTRLMEGMLCRYRGHSTTEARHWFIQVWQILRSAYLNRAACPPRVWQL